MTRVDPKAADLLVKLCGMLGGARDGERAAAVAEASSLQRDLNLTWREVIAIRAKAKSEIRFNPKSWRDIRRYREGRERILNDRERDFIKSLSRWRGDLTDKQASWLARHLQETWAVRTPNGLRRECCKGGRRASSRIR